MTPAALPSPPKAAPKLLCYKDPADLAKQLDMHRMSALAQSFQQSTLVPLLKAPQNVPHKAPGVDYSGSELAANYADTVAAIVENQRQWRECEWRDWEKAARLDAQHVRLLTCKAALESELAAHDYAPPSRSGISGLYLVNVPSIALAGPHGLGEGLRAAERWELDTRGWAGELRESLSALLAAHDSQQPDRTRALVEYRADRRRYYWQSRAEQSERWLLTTSLTLLRRLDIWF